MNLRGEEALLASPLSITKRKRASRGAEEQEEKRQEELYVWTRVIPLCWNLRI